MFLNDIGSDSMISVPHSGGWSKLQELARQCQANQSGLLETLANLRPSYASLLSLENEDNKSTSNENISFGGNENTKAVDATGQEEVTVSADIEHHHQCALE